MLDVVLQVTTNKSNDKRVEKVALREEENRFFFELMAKLLEAKSKLSGDVNSNEKLFICVTVDSAPILIIDNMELKPVYTFENFKDMLKIE